MRTRASRQSGFTLIELVAVLIILTIALSMVAPSLHGWSQHSKLRDASDQCLATMRGARAQAVATGSVRRVLIDSSAASIVVQRRQGESYEAAEGELGRSLVLPRGFSIQLVSGGASGSAIDFYPNGRTTPATVRITSVTGESIDLACTSVAGTFSEVITQ